MNAHKCISGIAIACLRCSLSLVSGRFFHRQSLQKSRPEKQVRTISQVPATATTQDLCLFKLRIKNSTQFVISMCHLRTAREKVEVPLHVFTNIKFDWSSRAPRAGLLISILAASGTLLELLEESVPEKLPKKSPKNSQPARYGHILFARCCQHPFCICNIDISASPICANISFVT